MPTSARKYALYERGLVVREFEEDEGLEVKPETLLYAFDLMRSYATGKSNKAKLEHNQELALSLVDWALMECDRGIELLRLHEKLTLTNRPPPVNWP